MSILYATARRRVVLQACHAGVRSASSSSPQPLNLSPEKMRALIAIYHQAETFITRENLEEKIDEAFTGPESIQTRGDPGSLTMTDFNNLLGRRHDAASVTEWNASQPSFNPQIYASRPESSGGAKMSLWSSSRVARDSKVIEALHGVESLGGGMALPGLETLEDHADIIEESAREDAGYNEKDF
ncbi:hypothetical protein FB45DRAFT_903321 [Roridomyces roridus]|uniref:Uncharacterized protein n=1 Tax=Roridomyces roridus TaxID=1738132 RepID=A0AAD7C4A5_9AGAR|nr:hypothetical protein FB45DRAFT_903321 [Roridomyces roridus]